MGVGFVEQDEVVALVGKPDGADDCDELLLAFAKLVEVEGFLASLSNQLVFHALEYASGGELFEGEVEVVASAFEAGGELPETLLRVHVLLVGVGAGLGEGVSGDLAVIENGQFRFSAFFQIGGFC